MIRVGERNVSLGAIIFWDIQSVFEPKIVAAQENKPTPVHAFFGPIHSLFHFWNVRLSKDTLLGRALCTRTTGLDAVQSLVSHGHLILPIKLSVVDLYEHQVLIPQYPHKL